MIFFQAFNFNNTPKKTIYDDIEKIRQGDHLLKEKVINDYVPFIIKTVSRLTGKYIDTENSEEYSVGLMAFNDALNTYDKNRNINFFTYSEILIKRKILDYLKAAKKHRNVFPLSSFDTYEEEEFEVKYLALDSRNEFENIEFEEHIAAFEKRLHKYGITLTDLTIHCPKHRDSLQLATKIGIILAERDELFEKLQRTKNLPIAPLLKIFNVSRKTLERHRKYIIAISLILKSDLEVLKEFIKDLEKGGGKHG